MTCRRFRDRHLAWTDDALTGAEAAEMADHAARCAACAAFDNALRRGVLVARNLHAIHPSADFAARLDARLAAVRREAKAPGVRGGTARPSTAGALSRSVGAASRAALFALGGALAAGIGTVAWLRGEPASTAVPPAAVVVAVRTAPPLHEPTPQAAPVVVTAASTPSTVWPAALVADEAPAEFVRAAFVPAFEAQGDK